MGLDPLAAWTALDASHPILLVGGCLFALGIGVRSVAGELEAGTLEMTLARPLSRTSYLLAHVAVIVPGAALIAVGYSVGAVIGDRVFDPRGARLDPGRMLLAAGEFWVLLVALAMLALLVSALGSERGRALSWTIGIAIAMYAGNFLLTLWEPVKPLARLSLFRYVTPGPTIQFGTVPWRDVGMLAGFSIVAAALAIRRFATRDLV